MKCCVLLFQQISSDIRRSFGGLGDKRLLDLFLEAVDEFRLLAAKGLPGELIEHAGRVRELALGDEALGFVDQLLGLAVIRGSSCFDGLRSLDFGGFRCLRKSVGVGTGGFSRVVRGSCSAFVVAATGQPEGERGTENEGDLLEFHGGISF